MNNLDQDTWICTAQESITCGKDAPSPPPAPDPTVTAAAQSAANTSTAAAQSALNNVNQVTPYGNLTYSQSGSYTTPNGDTVPQYTATTTLTPDEQNAVNNQQQLTSGLYGLANDQLGRINSSVSTPFDLSQFGPAPTADSNVLQNNINASYNQATSRLDPQYAQAQEQQDAQLRNQGFTPGTAGYDAAMSNFNQAKTDAYQTAENNAVAQGNAAEANQYNLSSSAYQTAIQNALMQRELPLNEASALESGGQIQSPSLVGTGQTGISPTNVTGAFGLQQSALQNAYSGNVAQTTANNNAAAGLGSSALTAAMMLALA